MENTLESIESFEFTAASMVDAEKLFPDKAYYKMYIAALRAENEVLRLRRILRGQHDTRRENHLSISFNSRKVIL